MKYLNLTPGFNPQPPSTKDEDIIKFESSTFPGGEPHFRLLNPKDAFNDITVIIQLNSFNDVGRLLIATDAINRTRNWFKFGEDYIRHLFVPYFPAARQDRIMINGEALSSKVYANLINDLAYNTVTILDPHSEVIVNMLDNVIVLDNIPYLDEALDNWRFNLKSRSETFSIVLPDKGAAKKLKTFVKLANFPTRVYIGEKKRDLVTGKLSGFDVDCKDFKGEDLFIADDICDGGGTFMGLAKVLKERNAGNLYLFVTHGIFSKGFTELNKYFRKIYTTDSFRSSDNGTALEIINLKI